MLDCLKHMEEFDPEGAQIAEKTIWEELAAAAGVQHRELSRAYSQIVWNGYYGPVSDQEYYEALDDQPNQPMTMRRAMEIIHAALEASIHIEYKHFDYGWSCTGSGDCSHRDHDDCGDNGPMFHLEPIIVEMEQIKRSCFPEIVEIYGGWI